MHATATGLLAEHRKTSNIRCTKSLNLNVRLAVVFAQSIEARCKAENEDVGAAPTGNALTTSEWSTILLPTKVQLILEVLQYIYLYSKGPSVKW